MPQHDSSPDLSLSLLSAPYRELRPLRSTAELLERRRPLQGMALVWELERGDWARSYRQIRMRPGGLALLVVLPRAEGLESVSALLEMTEQCRPHSLLPFHPTPDVEELATLLRRPPSDLPGEVMDYIGWRGVRVDRDTRHLIRKTIELSRELKTVSALSRSLYLSRRALGRRFLSRGLPVPSHWLHFSRILRVVLELQNTDRSLFQIACGLGYPDGFSVSNQMKRLTGVRPSTARNHLGWEWLVEAWLRTEARVGGLTHPLDGLPPARVRAGALDRPGDWRGTQAGRESGSKAGDGSSA